jgi:hypothetical protein
LGCLCLSATTSVASLVLSAFVFSLVIKKVGVHLHISKLSTLQFLIPNTEIWFSKFLVQNVRDGVKVLQFRVANTRGFAMTNIKIKATLGVPRISSEGERFTQPIPLVFIGPNFTLLPCMLLL